MYFFRCIWCIPTSCIAVSRQHACDTVVVENFLFSHTRPPSAQVKNDPEECHQLMLNMKLVFNDRLAVF